MDKTIERFYKQWRRDTKQDILDYYLRVFCILDLDWYGYLALCKARDREIELLNLPST